MLIIHDVYTNYFPLISTNRILKIMKWTIIAVICLLTVVFPLSVTHALQGTDTGIPLSDTLYENQVGSYYYDTDGGGFSKFIDLEGNDWISYKPTGGSDGKYRGIPNMVHTPNDATKSYFHPGYTNATTTGITTGNSIQSFMTSSNDGKWEVVWEIHPTFLKMNVQKTDPTRNYWFLYEGTPGGTLEPNSDMYATSSTPTLRPMSTEFKADLTDPEWIYFVDPNASYGLVIFNDAADYAIDSYYPMNGEMTVFGFGRDRLSSLIEQPHTFYLTFIEKQTSNLDTYMRALLRTIKTDDANPPSDIPTPTLTPLPTTPNTTPSETPSIDPPPSIIPTSSPITTPTPVVTPPLHLELHSLLTNYLSFNAEHDLNQDGIVNFADILE